MKRFTCSLVLLIFASMSLAADNNRDGNWWREQPQVLKFAYMTGSSNFVINWRWTNACPSAAPLRTAHSLSVPGMRYSAV
jgi:hypothetical protein